jgi:hypothetical protein
MRTIGRSLVISGPRPILEPYHKTVVWAICEEKFEWSHFWGQPGCRWLPGCDLDRPGLMLNRKAKFEQNFFNNFFSSPGVVVAKGPRLVQFSLQNQKCKTSFPHWWGIPGMVMGPKIGFHQNAGLKRYSRIQNCQTCVGSVGLKD